MSYDVIASHNLKIDGREVKQGEPFPYNPDDLTHQLWMRQGRVKVVKLEATPTKKVKA